MAAQDGRGMATLDIVIVSDTHGQHEALGDLHGDILIHCGDGCDGHRDDPAMHDRLDAWLARQRFGAIFAVGGNHDFEFERRARAGIPVFRAARALMDETVTWAGVRIHGSPWTPQLADWAFFGSEARLRAAWASVPSGIDILVTHTGPAGILDRNRYGHSIGCPHLATELARIRPRLHVFGHHHASAGHLEQDGTLHVNASMVDSYYRIARKAWRVRLETDPRRAPALHAG
jgi:Icc-related predicted phosphoesterase